MTLKEMLKVTTDSEFEQKQIVMRFLQMYNVQDLIFWDKKYDIEYKVKFIGMGYVYLEPTYYEGEREAVQFRVPMEDLLDYEVIK